MYFPDSVIMNARVRITVQQHEERTKKQKDKGTVRKKKQKTEIVRENREGSLLYLCLSMFLFKKACGSERAQRASLSLQHHSAFHAPPPSTQCRPLHMPYLHNP
jgi:hypothetical protein